MPKATAFWEVGHTRIGSVREFVNQILTEATAPYAAKNAVHGVRVVYRFSTVDGDGNNTQFLKLTNDDLRLLQIVSDHFGPSRSDLQRRVLIPARLVAMAYCWIRTQRPLGKPQAA